MTLTTQVRQILIGLFDQFMFDAVSSFRAGVQCALFVTLKREACVSSDRNVLNILCICVFIYSSTFFVPVSPE